MFVSGILIALSLTSNKNTKLLYGSYVTHKRKIDQVLNVAGLLQPQSVFLIRRTLEKVKSGETLEIVTDKRKSAYFFTTLSPKYKIVEKKEMRGFYHYIITRN